MKNATTHKPLKNKCNILIVEDNLLLADAIEMVLKLKDSKNSAQKINIYKALNYENAIEIIEEILRDGVLDVVILDINLGNSKGENRKSGEELGILLREYIPKTKIIVFTSYNDGLRINSVLKNINPEGFLIKDSTTDHKTLQKVVSKVVSGQTHYCDTVVSILRKKNKIKQKLDAIDLKLLYELSNATKLKDMPDYVPLTISGVEKRRRRLKEIFEVDSDRGLVLQAKAIGFL